jgi:tetratricopeptide (TPR) repeat protein
VPIGQLGRDQAGVPHLALIPPRTAPGAGDELLIAEGLIDDVTVALTRLRSVSILAAYSARKVANGDDTGGVALARADFVLRTKLTTNAAHGRGPRLTLLLERVASGDIVWAEDIVLDADHGPIQFAAIANGVALTLVDQIERATLRAFQVPSEAGAYGHYLLGQKALQVLDLPSTRRARASFKAAMSLSPEFAPAYTGFAQSMIYEWVMRGQGDTALLLRARHAAERAREIDPLFGSAHQMLGRASLFEGDFNASLVHFEQAEAFNPHHADLLCDFADTLMHSSLAQRANDKIELALRLNPLAPDAYWWASAGIKFFVGDYDGALSHLDKVKNSEPVLRLTAACAAMAGQHELAKLARNQFLAIDPGFNLDDWIGVLPVRDPAHRRQYRQALQQAGFK